MGANQDVQKLLSTDLVKLILILIYYSKNGYFPFLLPVAATMSERNTCKCKTKAAGFAVTSTYNLSMLP